MQDRLRDKAIIVIGGGSGIGAGTVRRLLAEGARVCVADINLAAAEKVARDASAADGTAFALEVDISDEGSVQTMVGAAVDRLGGLDGAHVNAADLRIVYQDSDALAEELSVFDRTLSVNLRGHLLCTRAVLPHLLAQGGGALVYSSSGASQSGAPSLPAYATSKAGLEALMRHVAARWGREGVTANCIAPGVVITPEAKASGQVPKDFIETHLARVCTPRLGTVEDLAGVIAMLLSDDGRWITGQVFHINGGSIMR